jgi:hypothetical protein
MFELLGWTLKVPPEGLDAHLKSSFQVLGCEIDLSRIVSHDEILVKNKAGRVDDIKTIMKGIMTKGVITPHEAESLRGKFRYTGAQCLGRLGAWPLKVLGMVAEKGASRPMDTVVIRAFKMMSTILGDGVPRSVSTARVAPRSVLLFTDGACEEEGANVTAGGALVSPCGARLFFSYRVPEVLKEAWRDREEQHQLVFIAEICPLIIAREIWPKYLRGAPVLQFVDNDAARWSVIRGYTSSVAGAGLIDKFWELDIGLRCRTWTDRVRSESNLGDAPSRFDKEAMRRLGFEESTVPGHLYATDWWGAEL